MDLDALKKLPRELQVVLGGTVLYIVFSFFDWQQVSFGTDFGGGTFGYTEWHGFGVVTALVAILLLVWEIMRLLNIRINLGSVTPGQISIALAAVLLVFTVITFLTHNEARHWPAWVGLILSIAIAAAAFARAKAEGVQIPEIPKNISMGGTGGGSAATASTAATASAAPTATPTSPATGGDEAPSGADAIDT